MDDIFRSQIQVYPGQVLDLLSLLHHIIYPAIQSIPEYPSGLCHKSSIHTDPGVEMIRYDDHNQHEGTPGHPGNGGGTVKAVFKVEPQPSCQGGKVEMSHRSSRYLDAKLNMLPVCHHC